MKKEKSKLLEKSPLQEGLEQRFSNGVAVDVPIIYWFLQLSRSLSEAWGAGGSRQSPAAGSSSICLSQSAKKILFSVCALMWKRLGGTGLLSKIKEITKPC